MLAGGVVLVTVDRCHQPDGVTEEVGIGVLDAAEFLARHGMAGKNALGSLRAEEFSGAFDELLLRASSIRNQRGWRDHRADSFQLRQDAADGCAREITSLSAMARSRSASARSMALRACAISRTARLSQPMMSPSKPACFRASPSEP